MRDPSKPDPLFWKLPGGHSKPGEDMYDCAIREVAEETGIDLRYKKSCMQLMATINRPSHLLCVFMIKLPYLPTMSENGIEGEEVRVFTPYQIFRMRDFLPAHRRLVGQEIASLIK